MSNAEISQDCYREAFDLVAPKGDWKGPIDATVSVSKLKEMGITVAHLVEAIEFYTATEAKVTAPEEAGDLLFVRAAGYRAGPAF